MEIKEGLILSIIPARGGSKGIKKKNIKILGEKPLIAYTIEASLNSKNINRTIVSTDNDEIAAISQELGAEIPFLRPDNLSNDNSSTIDVVSHTLNYIKENEKKLPEYIILLQPTSPFRSYKHIDEAINQMKRNNTDAVASVCKSKSNPYWTLVLKNNKLEYLINEGKKITRRQDLPESYDLNGAIYIIKTKIFLKEKTFEPENLSAYIMDDKFSIDIDEELDFKFAELILKEGKL